MNVSIYKTCLDTSIFGQIKNTYFGTEEVRALLYLSIPLVFSSNCLSSENTHGQFIYSRISLKGLQWQYGMHSIQPSNDELSGNAWSKAPSFFYFALHNRFRPPPIEAEPLLFNS